MIYLYNSILFLRLDVRHIHNTIYHAQSTLTSDQARHRNISENESITFNDINENMSQFHFLVLLAYFAY